MNRNHMNVNRLYIVDEQGTIIGEETRENIHREGLLHRIVHVWFYTPDKKIIFQIRGKDAEMSPNLLDATAGGHVEIGQNYLEAAVMETREETGVHVVPDELQSLGVMKSGPTTDDVTHTLNHHLIAMFAYLFRGSMEHLQAEANEDGGLRFEAWPVETIGSLTGEEKKKFVPRLLKPDYLEIFRKIERLYR